MSAFSVPNWCDFFDEDEYDAFSEAVLKACGMFGADIQDSLDAGSITLVNGRFPEEEAYFSLDGLARRCRHAPNTDWEDMCARQVLAWMDLAPQREWLTQAPFEEVAPLLEVWLTAERKVTFQGEPTDPEQPFSMPLADGLHLSLVVQVPDFEDNESMKTPVSNAAVAAWGRSHEELIESARQVLRRLPGPIWSTRKLSYTDDEGARIDVELYVGASAPDVDLPVTAWAILLDEVWPMPMVRGAFVGLPERNTLILAPIPAAAYDVMTLMIALYLKVDLDYDAADYDARLSRSKFTYIGGIDGFEALPDVEGDDETAALPDPAQNTEASADDAVAAPDSRLVQWRSSLIDHLGPRSSELDLDDRPALDWTLEWASTRPGPAQRSFTGHTGEVSAVTVAELDGRPTVFSGDTDGHIWIWDLASGEPLGEPLTVPVSGYKGGVTAVAVATGPDGRPVIAARKYDGTVRVWDAATGTPIGEPVSGGSANGLLAIGFVDEHLIVAYSADDPVQSWYETVWIWDGATSIPMPSPVTPELRRRAALAIGRIDGRAVVCAASGYSPLEDESEAVGRVWIWDALSIAPVAPITAPGYRIHTFGHVDGRIVMISDDDDGALRIWDAGTGDPVGRPIGPTTANYLSSVSTGQVAGRPVVVTASYDTVQVWDVATGRPVGDPSTAHQGRVNSVSVGYLDGRTFTVSGGEDAAVRVSEVRIDAPVQQRWSGHVGCVRSVAVTQVEGRPTVLSAGDDATIRRWDARTGSPLGDPFRSEALAGVNALAVGQTGDRAVVASGANAKTYYWTLQVWDVATGAPIGGAHAIHDHHAVSSLALGVLEDEVVLISGDDGGYVRVVRPFANRMWDRQQLWRHPEPVRSVAISGHDGRTLIASAGDDWTVRVWDSTSDKQTASRFKGHTGSVRAVALARLDDRAIVVSGGNDGTVRIWDIDTRKLVCPPSVGHAGRINAVTVGRCGQRPVVVSAGEDRTVRTWDPATGIPIGDLPRPASEAEVPPSSFDVGAAAYGLAFTAPNRLVAATELGLVSLRLPNWS